MDTARAAPRRLFIGLLPDDAVREAIAAHQRHWHWRPGNRPTRASMLHLTLYFLGNAIDATREAALHDALAGETVAPFDLVLRTPESWPNGVAVVRPEMHPALDDLHARIGARLTSLGFGMHRDAWAPHVTLARDAANAIPPDPMRPIVWPVHDIALVWSRLDLHDHLVLRRYGAT